MLRAMRLISFFLLSSSLALACGDDKGASTESGTGGSTSSTSSTTAELTSSSDGSGTEGVTGTATSGSTSGSSTSSGSSGSTTGSSSSSSSSSTAGSSSSGSTGDTGGVTGALAKYSEECAPNDGPAVRFSIGLDVRECTGDFPADAPIFEITIYEPVHLAVGEHKLDNFQGIAYFDDGNGMPLTGMTGTLTIEAMSADGQIGSYDVTFSDNTHLTGSFDAIYCKQPVLCG